MSELYFTPPEIYKKFNILINDIDKIIFNLKSKNELIIDVIKNSNYLYNFIISKCNDKIYREIKNNGNEYTDDLSLKLSLNKFLEYIENNFDNIINILKSFNFENLEYKPETNKYVSGSKNRIRISKLLFVDINTNCDNDCLLFLDSEKDFSYDYYTILNIKEEKIIEHSILDFEVINTLKSNKEKLLTLSHMQNQLRNQFDAIKF